MSYYHDDDESIDVRVRRHRDSSPSPVHYVEAVRPPRPRSYYAQETYLVPERSQRTVVTTRSRSRERSRERRSSPPSQAPAAPVIINNYTGHSSSDDDSFVEERQMVRHRSHSHTRPRAPSSSYMTREEYELEETRRELEELKLRQNRGKRDDWELTRTRQDLEDIRKQQEREREQRSRDKEWKDQAELQRAKRELDEIKRREERELEEKRIKKELELRKLEEEKRAAEEKKAREHAEKDAIERYKLKEAERAAKEKAEKEAAEKEFQRRLQEQLIASGVDEKDIAAIIKKEKIRKEKEKEKEKDGGRPTYTRMARRHLSIETLRVYGIDFDYDTNPDYILIKRWVPEDEQDMLWRHTRLIREKREKKLVLEIEDGKHHHHGKRLEPEFEWVRKKERRRSKSPGLLMYLAGAK